MAARPHTRQEWMGLPQAKRGFPSYERYSQWWNRSVAPKFGQGGGGGGQVDYLAAVPQSQLMGQAQTTVRSQIDPFIKQITDSISRRSLEGSQKITQFNDRWFNALGPMQDSLSATYQRALDTEKAITGGITSFLGGQGDAAAANVSGQLQAAGMPQETIDEFGGSLATLGQGMAGQALGRGSIEQSALNAEMASELGYASKLPQFARRFGAERLQEFQTGLNNQQTELLGEVSSRVPGMVTDVYQQLLNREVEKAIARKGFELDQSRINASSQPDSGLNFDSGFSNFTGYAYDEDGNLILDASGQPIQKAGGGAAGKTDTKGIGEARKVAQKIHDNLMKKINPEFDFNKPAGKARTSIVLAGRRNAILQVKSTLRSYYPNQSEDWINQKAAEILAGSGFPGAAQEILGGTPGMGNTDAPAGAPAAPGTVAPKPAAKKTPKATAKNPDQRDRGNQAQQNQQQQRKREQQALGYVTNAAKRARESGMPRNAAQREIAKLLQKELKGWPYKRIVALAKQAIQSTYGDVYQDPAPGR